MDIIAVAERAKAGDQLALTEIFREYHNRVYYFALNHVKTPQDAEDIVQNTFIEVFKSISSPGDTKAVHSWLFTIAHRQIVAHHRKAGKAINADSEEFGEALDLVDDDKEFLPSSLVEDKEMQSALIEIIQSLPQAQKTAILLYYYEEMGLKDIAAVEGCSEGTIKSRLNYARKYIKTKIEERRKKGDYAIAVVPFPLLTWLFRQLSEQSTMQAEATQAMFVDICTATGIEAVGLATGATATTATATAGAATGLSALAKGVIGAVAAVAVAGGVLLAVILPSNNDLQVENYVPAEYVTAQNQQTDQVEPSQQQTENTRPFLGEGTEQSPFLLSEPEHLDWINTHWRDWCWHENRSAFNYRSAHYLMTSDIIALRNWNYNLGFFNYSLSGVFDGGGFTLTVDIYIIMVAKFLAGIILLEG